MRVYVETNFLVDLLRPLSTPAANQLFGKCPDELTIAIPWCCFTEAKRTLDRVIREDLGFVDNARRFLGRLHAEGDPLAADVSPQVNQFLDRARDRIRTKLEAYTQDLERVTRHVEVIPPSQPASELALNLNRNKQLKPFDEMILASVLADAHAQKATGEASLLFCSKNFRDFSPTPANGLELEYGAVGLQYRRDFVVP